MCESESRLRVHHLARLWFRGTHQTRHSPIAAVRLTPPLYPVAESRDHTYFARSRNTQDGTPLAHPKRGISFETAQASSSVPPLAGCAMRISWAMMLPRLCPTTDTCDRGVWGDRHVGARPDSQCCVASFYSEERLMRERHAAAKQEVCCTVLPAGSRSRSRVVK